MSEQPFRIIIAMRGGRPLFLREHLTSMLDAFASSVFALDRYSLEERGASCSRDELVDFATRQARPLPQTIVYARRTKAPKLRVLLNLTDRPGLTVEPDPKLAPKFWPALFQLADGLAAAFAPDWGTCHLLHDPGDDVSQDSLDAEIMMRSALLALNEYYDHGPRGLVMRTFIGPHFVRQLGDERVRTLPVEVEPTEWGGHRIDLVPRPWEAAVDQLLPPWRAAMEHLRPAEVIAIPVIHNGRLGGFVKAPRCEIEKPK